MKKLTILLFSILISFSSYGEWVQVSKGVSGTTTFINIDKIKENNDYIYYWALTNYADGSNESAQAYRQSDCAVNRFKVLAFYSYSEPMGSGRPASQFTPPDEWLYAIPNTVDDTLLTYTCNNVK
jgi:hypothetical protein